MQTSALQPLFVNPPAWPTIPVMQPIEAECRAIPHLPDWDDLNSDDEYQAERELAGNLITCDWCGRDCEPHQIMRSRVGCDQCTSNQAED